MAGYTALAGGGTAAEMIRRATRAADAAALHLDLRPQAWTPAVDAEVAARDTGPGWRHRLRTPMQIAATFVAGIALPFVVYFVLGQTGHDITGVAYIVVVVALLVTAASIWIEGFLALSPVQPPDEPGNPWPTGSAIIAAYLPNEAATVMDTVRAFRSTTRRACRSSWPTTPPATWPSSRNWWPWPLRTLASCRYGWPARPARRRT